MFYDVNIYDIRIGTVKLDEVDMHHSVFSGVIDSNCFEGAFMNEVKRLIYGRLIDNIGVYAVVRKFIQRGLNFTNKESSRFMVDPEFRILENGRFSIHGGDLFKGESFLLKPHFYFYSDKSHPFSQYYKCALKWNRIEFNSLAEYMFYRKASLFDDYDVLEKYDDIENPYIDSFDKVQIKGFNEGKWLDEEEYILYEGNYAKFTQNPALKDILVSTKGKTIVCAFEHKIRLGIGMNENNVDAQNIKKWKGVNLEGFILSELRQEYITEGRDFYGSTVYSSY